MVGCGLMLGQWLVVGLGPEMITVCSGLVSNNFELCTSMDDSG